MLRAGEKAVHLHPLTLRQIIAVVEEMEGLGARDVPPSTERRSHRKYEVSINFFYAMVRKQCTEGDGVIKIPTETVFYLLLAYTAFCMMRESSGTMKHVQVSFLRKLLQTHETIEVFREHIRSSTYFCTKGCTIWKSSKGKGSNEAGHTMLGSFGKWFGTDSDVSCSGINEFIDKITSGGSPKDKSCQRNAKRLRCADLNTVSRRKGGVSTSVKFTSLAAPNNEPFFSVPEEASVLDDPEMWYECS